MSRTPWAHTSQTAAALWHRDQMAAAWGLTLLAHPRQVIASPPVSLLIAFQAQQIVHSVTRPGLWAQAWAICRFPGATGRLSRMARSERMGLEAPCLAAHVAPPVTRVAFDLTVAQVEAKQMRLPFVVSGTHSLSGRPGGILIVTADLDDLSQLCCRSQFFSYRLDVHAPTRTRIPLGLSFARFFPELYLCQHSAARPCPSVACSSHSCWHVGAPS